MSFETDSKLFLQSMKNESRLVVAYLAPGPLLPFSIRPAGTDSPVSNS